MFRCSLLKPDGYPVDLVIGGGALKGTVTVYRSEVRRMTAIYCRTLIVGVAVYTYYYYYIVWDKVMTVHPYVIYRSGSAHHCSLYLDLHRRPESDPETVVR